MTSRLLSLGLMASLLLCSTTLASSVSRAWFQQDQTTENLATFDGELRYDPTQSDGELTVTLTNTTPAEDGGKITGLALNLPGGITAGQLSDTNAPAVYFDDLGSDLNANPFGTFDRGAGTGGNWQGGFPQHGLARDTEGRFTFDLEGDTAAIEAADFLTASNSSSNPGLGFGRSQGGPPSLGSEGLAVRFQAIGEGSDKATAKVVAVPTPAPVWAGIVLLAVALVAGRGRSICPSKD